MKYDFDKVVYRRGTGAIKWDVKENELPMWVADMDFEAAPAIREALAKRVEHGIFGYAECPDSWYRAYIDFFHDVHGLEISKDSLLFCLGVVPTLSSSVRALTEAGDEVVVMPPVYNIFYNSIRNSHRVIVEVPLKKEGEVYMMDYEGLEKAFSSPKCKLCFFCNPGNPVARIWEKEEIGRLIEIAKRHHVIILSDEIHGEITRPGHPYVPFLSVDGAEEVGYAAVSPTKCFNLAGIHTSAIIISNEDIRAKVNRQINTDEVAEPNVFSCVAAEAAFNGGREWLEQMKEYVFANRDYAENYINSHIKGLRALHGDATYLLWIDCREISGNSAPFLKFLREKTGLFLNDGSAYGKTGDGYLRMNLATTRANVEDGLKRLEEGVRLFLNRG